MVEKLQESVQSLKCLSKIEIEAFRLYEALSKKINPPESSFILCLAYDSLKCAKITEGILDYIDVPEPENVNCKKNLTEIANNISKFTKKLSKTNNLNYELSCEILKELTNLEDQLSEVYTNYLQSAAVKNIADEFSKLASNLADFRKIFEIFIEQKQKHRETLLKSYIDRRKKQRDLEPWRQHSNIKTLTNGSMNQHFTPSQTHKPKKTFKTPPINLSNQLRRL